MSLFISEAYAAADAAANAQAASPYSSIIMMVGFLALLYFMMWRPQSKKAKEHRDLMGSLQKGDEVITNAGILGRINKVADDFIVIDIADNVEIKMQKSAVSATVPKGTFKSV